MADAWARVRAPWHGRYVPAAFVASSSAVAVAAAGAIGWGAPTLGHGASWRALAGTALAGALAAFAASRTWGQTAARTRKLSVAVAVVLLAAFSLGVATNPVVVNGQVFLSTSKEAHEYQLMTQVYTDLVRLHDLDTLLTYSAADAGAHYNEYQPASNDLTAMATKYASYRPTDLPDARFAETVSDIKSAAYWAAQAMDAKTQLNAQDDAKLADDVATDRTNFAEQWLAAGRALRFLSADLNIPITTMERE